MNENNQTGISENPNLIFEEVPGIITLNFPPEEFYKSLHKNKKIPRKNSSNISGSNSKVSVWKEFGSLAIKITAIISIAMLIFTFMYGFHYNIEPGMNPSVKDGDLILFYRLDKNYRAGDLVILTYQGQKQVRRVIATAGDTVDILEEGLMINGALQQELSIYQQTQRYVEGTEFPLTLGEGQIFVLGDARETATDSRIYGSVNADDIFGKVITIVRRRNF
ncbi:MAG: signal peptidase I [Oscillospiraceae bacterium]|nr:signal peptidase I [Oscillospiraceae bacterium]